MAADGARDSQTGRLVGMTVLRQESSEVHSTSFGIQIIRGSVQACASDVSRTDGRNLCSETSSQVAAHPYSNRYSRTNALLFSFP